MPEENTERAAGRTRSGAGGNLPALAELQKQLAEAQSQAAEYKDGWQRAVAEFQNYRGASRPRKLKPTRSPSAASSSATCPSWTTWSGPGGPSRRSGLGGRDRIDLP